MIGNGVNGGLFALSAVIPPLLCDKRTARMPWPAGFPGRIRAARRVACTRVPPVGVEPTLGTLLGGRPLPLGYGGGTIILRTQLPNRGVTKTSSVYFFPPSTAVSGRNAERN
jgi:hypothetical protein